MKRIRAAGFASCLAACLLHGATALAADSCREYKWDVSNEVRLFAGAPTALDAGTTVEAAPPVAAGKLYALTLQPQVNVRYAAPPSKKMLPMAPSAG